MMNARSLSAAFLPLLLALPGSADAALRVVATIPDLGAVVREIGGAQVTVEVLVAPNQDPHYVDARPNLVVPLSRADLLVVNGLELEVGWLPPLLRSCRNARIQLGQPGYFDGGLVVDRKQAPGTLPTRAQGDVHAAGNPHYTHDPLSTARVAVALGERLAQLDGAHAEAFRKRAASLAARLQALVQRGRARIAALPPQQRRLVAYHASLIYLFDSLGLEQVATVEPLPGIPPNPSHVAKVLGTLRNTGACAIVQEPYYPRNVSQTLAKLAKVKLVVLPGGANFTGGESYPARVTRTLEAIHGAITTP
jgi:zinc/manganese transport system substrate-binding protein